MLVGHFDICRGSHHSTSSLPALPCGQPTLFPAQQRMCQHASHMDSLQLRFSHTHLVLLGNQFGSSDTCDVLIWHNKLQHWRPMEFILPSACVLCTCRSLHHLPQTVRTNLHGLACTERPLLAPCDAQLLCQKPGIYNRSFLWPASQMNKNTSMLSAELDQHS